MKSFCLIWLLQSGYTSFTCGGIGITQETYDVDCFEDHILWMCWVKVRRVNSIHLLPNNRVRPVSLYRLPAYGKKGIGLFHNHDCTQRNIIVGKTVAEQNQRFQIFSLPTFQIKTLISSRGLIKWKLFYNTMFYIAPVIKTKVTITTEKQVHGLKSTFDHTYPVTFTI